MLCEGSILLYTREFTTIYTMHFVLHLLPFLFLWKTSCINELLYSRINIGTSLYKNVDLMFGFPNLCIGFDVFSSLNLLWNRFFKCWTSNLHNKHFCWSITDISKSEKSHQRHFFFFMVWYPNTKNIGIEIVLLSRTTWSWVMTCI